jgi:peptidoglycan-associated lipoprotein
MKLTRPAWLAVALAALIFGGCSSTGTRDGGEGADAAGGGADVVDGGSGAQTAGIGQGGSWAGNPLENPDSLLYTRKIYFDFDRSEIRSEFVPVLRAHAEYLSRNPGVNVTIEGHCDERGSREYNIGLGERRAASIQRFLEAEGVDSAQIGTISYGEERPQNLDHNENAWSLNRRGVLVY